MHAAAAKEADDMSNMLLVVTSFFMWLKNIISRKSAARVKNVVVLVTTESSIPHDVILEILSKLPLKFLLRLRCVSKSWNSIVSDPAFLKQFRKSSNPSILFHLIKNIRLLTSLGHNNERCLFNCSGGSRSSGSTPAQRPYIPWEEERGGVRYVSYYILSSCNGLIIFEGANRWGNVFILWNPSTRQFRYLPKCPHRSSRACYGFGYDGFTDDYKMVKCSDTEIHVFSVKSNTWGPGRIHGTRIQIKDSWEGVFLGGIFHWLSLPDRAATFDLGTEEIGEILLPERHPVVSADCAYLGTLSGWLCVRNFHKHGDTDADIRVDVWVMKEYGVVSSWTKLFVVRPENFHRRTTIYDVFQPFLYSTEDEVVDVVNRCVKPVAMEFDIKSLTYEDIVCWPKRNVYYHWCSLYHFPYMESLVPIGKGSSDNNSMKKRCFAFINGVSDMFFSSSQL